MIVLGLVAVFGSTACGYRAAYTAAREERWTVAAVPFKTPELGVVQSVLAGTRAGLSAAGALRSGSGYPRVVVEVLRVDEVAQGIRDTASGPMAGGSGIGVTARAWLERAQGAAPERDTGDVRRVETVAQDRNSEWSGNAFTEGGRAAARRVGEALARRLLGEAEPSVEPL